MSYWLLFILLFLNSFSLFSQEEGSAKGQFKNISDQVKNIYVNPYLKYQLDNETILREFAWYRDLNGETKNIPSESGRAFQADYKFTNHSHTLVKGSGPNEEFTKNNTIKYEDQYTPKVDFHGKFKITEAYLDMYNAEFLKQIGVKVSMPVAILDLGNDATFSPIDGVSNKSCLYVRSFEEQLRISNLSKLSNEEIKNAFNRIIDYLYLSKQTTEKLTLKEYYYFMVDRVAKNAGLMQAAGFQHGVLHNQQVSLTGEMIDLGTGYWMDYPQFNSQYKTPHSPYSYFVHQPIQFQNFLVRSHAMGGDKPIPLLENSKTLSEQKNSLLGALLKIDPVIGQEILNENPASYFWNKFDEAYRTFDKNNFLQNFNPSSYFGLKDGLIFPKELDTKEKKLSSQNLLRKRTDAQILKRNYFADELILKQLEGKGNSSHQLVLDIKKVFEVPKSDILPDQIFKLEINDESIVFHKFLQDFSEKLSEIKLSDATLKQKWTRSLDLVATHMRLQYRSRPSLIKDELGYTFEHYKRYKFGGTNIDYLIDYNKGQCHDQCVIGFFLGKEVEKVYPEFDFRIFKSFNIGPTGRTHFYLMTKLPDQEIRLIDPLWGHGQTTIDDLVRFPFLPKVSDVLQNYFDHQEYLGFEENINKKNKCNYLFYPVP